VISKGLVVVAKGTMRAIVIEDLRGYALGVRLGVSNGGGMVSGRSTS
jgi:hypothetical protein